MKIKILLAATLACALPILPTLGPLALPSALADANNTLDALDANDALDAAMIGEWKHASNGDSFEFRQDGTYEFTAGKPKEPTGTVSHSGTWSVSNYRPSRNDNPSMGTLNLRTTRRIILQGGKYRDVRTTRRLSVPIATTEAEGQVIINRVSYWQKGVEPS